MNFVTENTERFTTLWLTNKSISDLNNRLVVIPSIITYKAYLVT